MCLIGANIFNLLKSIRYLIFGKFIEMATLVGVFFENYKIECNLLI